MIFVDIETLRGRPYPDVLIELLKELLDHLAARLRADGLRKSWRRRNLLRRVSTLSEALSQLLQEPQLAEHTVTKLRSQANRAAKDWSFTATGRFGARGPGAATDGAASGGVSGLSEQSDAEQATVAARFEKSKMDGLVEAAIFIREILGEAQKELAVPTLVVLDDFYHIALDDQAEVLAYLHQVVKGLDISLKVCGVERLLQAIRGRRSPTRHPARAGRRHGSLGYHARAV